MPPAEGRALPSINFGCSVTGKPQAQAMPWPIVAAGNRATRRFAEPFRTDSSTALHLQRTYRKAAITKSRSSRRAFATRPSGCWFRRAGPPRRSRAGKEVRITGASRRGIRAVRDSPRHPRGLHASGPTQAYARGRPSPTAAAADPSTGPAGPDGVQRSWRAIDVFTAPSKLSPSFAGVCSSRYLSRASTSSPRSPWRVSRSLILASTFAARSVGDSSL